MRFKAILPSVFLCATLCSMTTRAADSVAPSAPFESGIAAFQKGDLPQARTSFTETLKADPNNVSALYDLGLTEQKAGHVGLALAFWRKALASAPTFMAARRAVDYTAARLEHGEIPHEVEFWETLHDAVFSRVSLDLFLALTAVTFFGAGWYLLAYFGARRRARLDESAFPGFPTFATLVTLVFVAALALSICKAIDEDTLRATIVTKKVEALSSPDKSATPLFDLYEGLEVIVREHHAEWVQVNYPGGSTGWVPTTAIVATNQPI